MKLQDHIFFVVLFVFCYVFNISYPPLKLQTHIIVVVLFVYCYVFDISDPPPKLQTHIVFVVLFVYCYVFDIPDPPPKLQTHIFVVVLFVYCYVFDIPDPPPKLQTLSQDLSTLVDNTLFSDVTFSVDGHVVSGHKAILAVRSDYFHAMFCDNMKESKSKVGVFWMISSRKGIQDIYR